MLQNFGRAGSRVHGTHQEVLEVPCFGESPAAASSTEAAPAHGVIKEGILYRSCLNVHVNELEFQIVPH